MSVTENPPTAGFSCSFPKISVNQITLSPKKRQPPSPETARTAGGSDRPGAIKAPGFSPAILSTAGFTLTSGEKRVPTAVNGFRTRARQGPKAVVCGHGCHPAPIRPTQRLTRANRGGIVGGINDREKMAFSLSTAYQNPAGRRESVAVQRPVSISALRPSGRKSGCGRQPAKCVWLPVASQTLCLPHLRVGKLPSPTCCQQRPGDATPRRGDTSCCACFFPSPVVH